MKNIFQSTIKKIQSKKLLLNKINKKELKDLLNKKYKSFKLKSILPNYKSISINPKKLIRNLQDSLDKYTRNEQNEVILRPASYWASSITWTLLGGTFFGIVWLSLAKTEEIIISTGKLEPIG